MPFTRRCPNTHFPDSHSHTDATTQTTHHHLISSLRKSNRGCGPPPDRNLYHLQHGGKLLMLTADTLLHTVAQMLHPHTHTSPPKSPSTPPLTATHVSRGRCLFSLSASTPLSPHLCLYFLVSVEHNAGPPSPSSLPSSSSLLHLSASLRSATMLPFVQRAVSWQTE